MTPMQSPRPLTTSERNARNFNWLSYSAVVQFKDGNEDVITVQALNEEDAYYRVNLRANVKVILHIYLNGEAY